MARRNLERCVESLSFQKLVIAQSVDEKAALSHLNHQTLPVLFRL